MGTHVFYGWRIVAVTFITHFISVGFIFYSYGVFFKALEVEFGGSRFGISAGLAIMNIAMGTFAIFLGRAVDRYSIRNIMMLGAAFMASGFFLASLIEELYQFYVVLATFLGIGAALLGLIPGSTLVSNWFVRRRGTALGIATMGVSTSGLVMAPVSAYLIESIGWRSTFILYGCLAVAVVVPLVGFFVVNNPERMGLFPDGDAEPPSESDAENAIDLSTKEIMASRSFWSITFTIGMSFFSMGAVLTHMIPYATDMGFSLRDSAFILSSCAGAGVFGKVLFGWIADHVDTRIAVWTAQSFQLVGVTLLLFADQSYSFFIAAGAIFGFGMGGIVPLWGSLIGEVFGRHSFGKIMGLMTPAMLPIQVLGVPFAGLTYDRTGSYDIAFKTFICMYFLAGCVLLTLKKGTVDQRMKQQTG